MKKITLIVLAALALSACKSLSYVSGQEFQRQYSLRNAQTLYYAEYIGEADGKVYLLKKNLSLSASEPKDQVIYTNTKDLDPAFLQELNQQKKGTSNQRVQGTPPGGGAPDP